MEELFPIVAGVVIGLIASRIPSVRTGVIVAAILTVIAAAAATFFSGEAGETWAFIFVDLLEVALAAAITWGLATLVARRLARPV